MVRSQSQSTLNRVPSPVLSLFLLGLTPTVAHNRTTVTNKRSTIATNVSVSDISGREDTFTLDRHGFQLCRHEAKSPCAEKGYGNEKEIEEEYYPEMEQFLKDMLVSLPSQLKQVPCHWLTGEPFSYLLGQEHHECLYSTIKLATVLRTGIAWELEINPCEGPFFGPMWINHMLGRSR